MRPASFSQVFFLIVLILGLAAASLWAQQAQPSGDTKPPSVTKYDLASEVKLKGIVQELKEVPAGKNETSTALILKVGGDTYEVHLAPASFLKDFDCALAKGDEITVTGSKLKVEGANVVLARQVTKGNLDWTLRDKQGAPLWGPRRAG